MYNVIVAELELWYLISLHTRSVDKKDVLHSVCCLLYPLGDSVFSTILLYAKLAHSAWNTAVVSPSKN